MYDLRFGDALAFPLALAFGCDDVGAPSPCFENKISN